MQLQARLSQPTLLATSQSRSSKIVLQRPEPTELEKDLLRKAKEMSINPKEGQGASKDETDLVDEDFLKDVMKDLNMDVEGSDTKQIINEIMKKDKKDDKPDEQKKKDEEKK
jgi:hypothetical protein